MTETHRQHTGAHSHVHGPNCGHTAVRHDGHTDYLHDGHLHYIHGDHVDDHKVEVTAVNPDKCTPSNHCTVNGKPHTHGFNCGHEVVPHGNHVDYLVDGQLHHPHGTHCDEHGKASWKWWPGPRLVLKRIVPRHRFRVKAQTAFRASHNAPPVAAAPLRFCRPSPAARGRYLQMPIDDV